MTELILGLGITYLIVTFIVFLRYLIGWTENRNNPYLYSRAEVREEARKALMCWTWPAWVFKVIAEIYRDAFPKKE